MSNEYLQNIIMLLAWHGMATCLKHTALETRYLCLVIPVPSFRLHPGMC